MPRVVVTLGRDEFGALIELATHELRTPQDQLRLLTREALVRRGKLRTEPEGMDQTTWKRTNDHGEEHG